MPTDWSKVKATRRGAIKQYQRIYPYGGDSVTGVVAQYADDEFVAEIDGRAGIPYPCGKASELADAKGLADAKAAELGYEVDDGKAAQAKGKPRKPKGK